MAMQMRFLQTLSDVGAENNTTIVFPMPIELLNAFVKNGSQNGKSRRTKPSSAATTEVPLPRETMLPPDTKR
jgi:hypothetical protein